MAYPNNPAYIPNNFMPFGERMGFWERVENSLCYVYNQLLFNVIMDAYDNWVARKYISQDLPVLEEIMGNVSLILLNSHFALTRPRPAVPGFIEVGGMHLGIPKRTPEVNYFRFDYFYAFD